MHQIRKLLRIYQGILIPIVVITLSSTIMFFGVIPAARTIYQHFMDSNSISEDIKNIKKRISILSNYDEDTLKQQVDELLAAVPADKSLPSIILTIEKVGADSGVAITDLTIANPGSLATVSAQAVDPKLASNTLTVDTVVEGSVESMQKFLDAIVAIRRLLDVKHMSVTFGADGLARAQITIQAFFSVYPKTLGKASDTLNELSTKEETVLSQVLSYPDKTKEALGAISVQSGQVETGKKSDLFSP